jgi:hypothetical protein
LGVAGGELLIPTMMFIFGADIKTAGTASIVVSVCVVTSGLWRYWRSGAMETRLGARRIVSAMSAGSLIGAALGGMAVGFAPVGATNKPDNDAERKACTKVKSRASGDHLRVLKWVDALEKDQYAERRK